MGPPLIAYFVLMIPLAAILGSYWIKHKKLEVERMKEFNNAGRFPLAGGDVAPQVKQELETLRQENQQLRSQVSQLTQLVQQRKSETPMLLNNANVVHTPTPTIQELDPLPLDDNARRIAELAKRFSGNNAL